MCHADCVNCAGSQVTMNWTSSDLLAGLSALVALVAVIVGPFIAARAAKNQMLGPMRQAWINELRDAISDFVARVEMGQVVTSGLLSDDETVRHDAAVRRREHFERTAQIKARIELLVNPNEAGHQELVRLVSVAHQAYTREVDAGPSLRALVAQVQVVLKKEWNVVKK